MSRVYEIEGAEAYLVGTISTSASIYREYRMVLTHERIKMDKPAIATSKCRSNCPMQAAPSQTSNWRWLPLMCSINRIRRPYPQCS